MSNKCKYNTGKQESDTTKVQGCENVILYTFTAQSSCVQRVRSVSHSGGDVMVIKIVTMEVMNLVKKNAVRFYPQYFITAVDRRGI